MAVSLSLMKEEEQHILKVLPILLKRDTQFRTEVYSVLMQTFATKDDLNRILEEMRISREETNKRFEAMDRRFEAMDKRFEAMDKRFEEMQEEMRISREETNKRFEEMQKQMDKRFEEMQKQIEGWFMETRLEIAEDFKYHKDWVGAVVGGLQHRAGRNLEDTIAGTLKVALKRKDIKPESLKLRQKITDNEGIVGPKGRKYEIDIWANNSETMLFEIKSYAEPEDVLRFNDKVNLVTKELNLTHPSKVFITLQKDNEMEKVCKELGVELV